MKGGLLRWLALNGLAILALGIAGCPALIVASSAGSLGYEGYQYQKTGKLPGMPSQSQSQPRANPTPTLDDIE